MTGIEAVLVLIGAIVLFWAGVILTIVLILRALARRVRRSAAVNGTALRTRARLSHGPQRKVLGLRVRLDDALKSGRAAIDLVPDRDGSARELARLYKRIADEGTVLDLQLRLMESETDASALADELPAARHRVDQVASLVRRVRSAVASALSGSTDDALSAIGMDVDREITALQAGIEQLRLMNRRDGRTEQTLQATTTISTVRDEGTRP